MKKTYFVFSDVHAEYDALVRALNDAGYDMDNPNHILVSLGDNFDRGGDSHSVYALLSRRKDNICVKGNHDVMLEEALKKGGKDPLTLFNCLHNGLDKTLASFSHQELAGIVTTDRIDDIVEMIKVRIPKLLPWLESMPLYYETDNYIFVHAGLDPNLSNWKSTDPDFMLWDVKYSHCDLPRVNKKVIIGHHHAFRVRQILESKDMRTTALPSAIKCYGNTDEHAPVRHANKIAIDPCSNYTGKVNVLVFSDTDKIHAVPEVKNENITTPPPSEEAYTYTYVNGNGDGFRITADDINTTYTINYGTFHNWG